MAVIFVIKVYCDAIWHTAFLKCEVLQHLRLCCGGTHLCGTTCGNGGGDDDGGCGCGDSGLGGCGWRGAGGGDGHGG